MIRKAIGSATPIRGGSKKKAQKSDQGVGDRGRL